MRAKTLFIIHPNVARLCSASINQVKNMCSHNSIKPNQGICYGCVIRRIGLIVAGVKDSNYRNDILRSENLRSSQCDNMVQLLNFSLSFLNDIDELPEYLSKPIRMYKKEKVFERFSLDTFAALLLLGEKNLLREKIFVKYLERALSLVGKEEIENRISAVRSSEFKPDFTAKFKVILLIDDFSGRS